MMGLFLRFGLSALLPAFRAASCLGWYREKSSGPIFSSLWHSATLAVGHSWALFFKNACVRSLLGGAEARQTARALADPPHARRTM